MNAYLFNGCIAVGWLMFLAGACLMSLAWGVLASGLLLLALTLRMAHIGGIYMPKGGAD